MEPITLSLLIFGIMIALMVVRVPIAVAMFVAGTTGYLMQAGWLPYANFLKTQTYSRFSNYDLSVIPLFLLMGQFATHGGLSRALFAFTNSLMSRVRGGMAMAAVIACAAFGAVCGSSVATAATVGTVALPEMTRHGYSGRLTTATLAAGGTLGIMIPPSVILVIYAILTEQNIAKLFAAAMIPGLIAMLGYLVAIAIYVRLVPGQAPERDEIEKVDMRDAVAGLLPIGVIFLLVFGGIYGGVFTPTEGAAVGAVSTLLLAFARGELTRHKLAASFYQAAESSAMIFLIFIGADLMNSALALTQVPTQLAQAVGESGLPPLAIVGAILVFYIVLGCVMDELSMILLTVPIFFPMVMGLELWGLDPTGKAIWFGVLILMVVGIGLIAPPVGLNVYIVNGLAKGVPIGESYRGVVPFLVSDLLRTLLLLFVPSLSLFLVGFMD
ncbi:TRAP transporter large permease [Burkholderiaceae bacterium FT117]|uniref:TRAP transporter large permease n=1 Tax=Zeimonas sediminis TaxID=2944268 RepID=UPI00234313EB|nr:TRAP transporter large permease [Zeimonas sediminis]MCM5571333.1 TRAP transporter large permease [Zeimonas sediminis]